MSVARSVPCCAEYARLSRRGFLAGAAALAAFFGILGGALLGLFFAHRGSLTRLVTGEVPLPRPVAE